MSFQRVFTEARCDGVVALIEYLRSPCGADIISLGSSTIGLLELIRSVEAGGNVDTARLRSLHIGSNDGSVTPLAWLEQLAAEFTNLPPSTQQAFDAFCRDLVAMMTAPSVEIDPATL